MRPVPPQIPLMRARTGGSDTAPMVRVIWSLLARVLRGLKRRFFQNPVSLVARARNFLRFFGCFLKIFWGIVKIFWQEEKRVIRAVYAVF